MNCTQFRKYVYAFADGELDVKQNLEALEHLNMCQVCVKRVSEVQNLKSAMKRVLPSQGASDALRDRILVAIEAAPGDEGAVLNGPAGQDHSTSPSVVRSRWVMPLAVAAGVVFCFTLWQSFSGRDIEPGTITVVRAQAVKDVRDQHIHCVSLVGLRHHDESLSRDLPTVAARLSDRLNMRVLVPDLSSLGFEFVGADRCGIRGRYGAHVLYRSPSRGVMCSLFTVDAMSEFDATGGRRVGGREYFLGKSQNVRVAAWQEGTQTYILSVGDALSEDQLLSLVDNARTADVSSIGPHSERYARLAGRMAP